MNDICNNCRNRVVMHAFSFSNCEGCNMEISTPHIPGYKFCDDCAEKGNKCKQCGHEL